MKAIILSLLFMTAMFAQEIIEHKIPNSNKIVIKFYFKNGSIADPAGKEGLTYITSSLITQGGTGELSYSDIQSKIYPMAASYFSSIDKEVSIFTFQVHKDWVDEFYPIMIGLITNPSFSQNDFSRVQNNVQVYVDQVIRASSDEEYSKKTLEDLLFRGTSYQHMVEGKSSSVKNINLDDVKNHYKNVYTTSNLTVGIAGGYSTDLISKIKNDLNKLSNIKVNLPKSLIKPNKPNGINVEIIEKDGAFGSAIFVGAPLEITRSNDDFASLMVANSYLGEHRKSYAKLYQEIREKRSMNYGDYSYIEWYNNGGSNMLPPSGVPRSTNYYSIWIRPVQIAKQLKSQYEELKDVKIGHAHFALRLALREMDRLTKEGLTQEEFEATRTFLRSYIKLYVRTPAEQLGYLMDSKFYGRKDWIKELDNLLSKLTLKDVNNAIKKYWQIENLFVTIVTDKSEATELANSLKNNSVSSMTYSNLVAAGLPAEIKAEDEKIAKFPLNVKNVVIIKSEDTFK